MPKPRNTVRFAEHQNKTILFCTSAYWKQLSCKQENINARDRRAARNWKQQGFEGLTGDTFDSSRSVDTNSDHRGVCPRGAEEVSHADLNRGRWCSSGSSVDVVKAPHQPRQPMRSNDVSCDECAVSFLEAAVEKEMYLRYNQQSAAAAAKTCSGSFTSQKDKCDPTSQRLRENENPGSSCCSPITEIRTLREQ